MFRVERIAIGTFILACIALFLLLGETTVVPRLAALLAVTVWVVIRTLQFMFG